MKILLVGNGAREHIIGEKLKASPRCTELVVYGSKVNPGLKALASVYHVGDLADMKALQEFAAQQRPDFAFVGPDNPIADGAADVLELIGIPAVAPKQALARIESSKGFARELLQKHHVPGSPQFKVFESDEGLEAFAEMLGTFVVKADGLTGGKGVQVMGDHFMTVSEGVAYARECLKHDGRVVLEEKLTGVEFSLMSFVDGKTVVDMPPIQDHKRAYEGDTGPNTGGMGTYSFAGNLPFLMPEDLVKAHQINVAAVQALQQETGGTYRGILYGGFMAVRDGVRLIEFNARFGDPEAMNALSVLETDFVEVCEAMLRGTLDQIDVSFAPLCTVCKYVVPEGYPGKPKKGEHFKLKPLPKGVKAYFASVDEDHEGLVMSGSRAMAMVGVAKSIEAAEALAQKGVECAEGPVFYRSDIGTRPLIEKRVALMRQLRT